MACGSGDGTIALELPCPAQVCNGGNAPRGIVFDRTLTLTTAAQPRAQALRVTSALPGKLYVADAFTGVSTTGSTIPVSVMLRDAGLESLREEHEIVLLYYDLFDAGGNVLHGTVQGAAVEIPVVAIGGGGLIWFNTAFVGLYGDPRGPSPALLHEALHSLSLPLSRLRIPLGNVPAKAPSWRRGSAPAVARLQRLLGSATAVARRTTLPPRSR